MNLVAGLRQYDLARNRALALTRLVGRKPSKSKSTSTNVDRRHRLELLNSNDLPQVLAAAASTFHWADIGLSGIHILLDNGPAVIGKGL